MKTTFLILYSFLLLSTCQQQQVQYDNSVATTTVTETVEEDTSNIDDFCFNQDGFQYTQLGLACKKGDLEAVKTLLAKGADRDFAKQKGERKFDSFLVSLESGNLPLVKYIFEDVYKEHLGLDGDYQLRGSSYILLSSPLIIACKSNSLPVVSYLFKFRKFCNLLIFKTSPYPLQRGNEIVYDSQGVIERTSSRLIDNFYLFQQIYSPSWRGQGGRFLQIIDY